MNENFQPMWSALADMTDTKKQVFLLTSAMSTVAIVLLGAPFIATGFGMILALSLVSKAFSAGSILDAYACDVCGTHKGKLYGRLRLYGSVGWAVGGFLVCAINDSFGFDVNFIIIGVVNAFSIGIFALVVPSRAVATFQVIFFFVLRSFVSVEMEGDPKFSPGKEEKATMPDPRLLRAALFRPHVMGFFLELFVFGMAIGVVERMLFLFVLGPLEGSSTLCGFIILVSSLCNIPVFHHAGTLLRYFGHNGCLLIAQVCYFTRVFGYTLLTPATKNCILFLEVLFNRRSSPPPPRPSRANVSLRSQRWSCNIYIYVYMYFF